jgi:Mrp family chromosome partitioning ATPase
MSRIHEALKKAEQELAAAQGGPVQSNFSVAEPPVIERRVIDTDIAATVPAVAPPVSAYPSLGLPSFSSPFSLETMLARCATVPWSPDPKTMLFLNGDDNARGSEEFRTLRSRLYQIREKMTLKKILVTSALPKEGKSFTAANLAHRCRSAWATLAHHARHHFRSGPFRLSAGSE